MHNCSSWVQQCNFLCYCIANFKNKYFLKVTNEAELGCKCFFFTDATMKMNKIVCDDYKQLEEIILQEDDIPQIILPEYNDQDKLFKNINSKKKETNHCNNTNDCTNEKKISETENHKKVLRYPSFNNSSDFVEEESSNINYSMQLIRINNNKIEICQQASNYLKKLKSKIGVISIGGPARTGKSLLLNLLTKKQLFEVGSRIQACTQGI